MKQAFGGNTIWVAEFDVKNSGSFAHLHLMHIDQQGNAKIITAFRDTDGTIRVDYNISFFEDHRHDPSQQDGLKMQRLDGVTNAESAWQIALDEARAIDEAGVRYSTLWQNSNSVTARLVKTILGDEDFAVYENNPIDPGSGNRWDVDFHFGWKNNELNIGSFGGWTGGFGGGSGGSNGGFDPGQHRSTRNAEDDDHNANPALEPEPAEEQMEMELLLSSDHGNNDALEPTEYPDQYEEYTDQYEHPDIDALFV